MTCKLANPRRRPARAFTLVEVILATAILFMAMFAILGLLSSGLHAAGLLKQNGPTPGMIASEMTTSNQLEEGFENGRFGDLYPDYSWQRQITQYATNGLFQVDIAVFHNGDAMSSISFLMYKPDSGNRGLRR